MTENEAKKYRSIIEQAVVSLDDSAALKAPDLFPAWTESHSYSVDDRVKYNSVLYKCIQAHTSQADWTPDAAASLWAEVLPGQDEEEIGEWVQPDSTNPYAKGDRVTHNGKVWESTIDSNVWEPGVYGWEEIDE